MAKLISFDEEARRSLETGMNKLFVVSRCQNGAGCASTRLWFVNLDCQHGGQQGFHEASPKSISAKAVVY